jgi:hypothetical protein
MCAYPPFHDFHYHAQGHAFSGEFVRPQIHKIAALGSASLPLTGGEGHGHSESFALDGLVSLKRAYSHVSGSVTTSGIHTSHVTSVVEGLNILDVVTADRVVARLSSEHAPKQKEGHIIAVGTYIENLRVSGCPVEIEFDHSLFLKHKTFAELSKNLAAVKKSGKMAEESNGVILCSIVQSIKMDCTGVEVNGHVITVGQFGKIYIGEVLVEPGTKRLSLLRLQLGSPNEGLLTAADTGINGTHFP